MRIFASTSQAALPELAADCLPVLLYGRGDHKLIASAGAAVAEELEQSGLVTAERSLDLLSIALTVISADTAVLRGASPDGWTRELDLSIPVNDSAFWESEKTLLEDMLKFLTTDRWTLGFRSEPFRLSPKKIMDRPEPCVALLSGGMDSLIGTLDLSASGTKPLLVSQTVLGDGKKQSLFAREIGGGLAHLQLNHNADSPNENERSQRARSFIFLAYGTVAATSLRSYATGSSVPLVVSENGLISINPPLTDARLGSLSTRTTHPAFFARFQRLLDAAGLRVKVENPYRFKTKGEMLVECRDQAYLLKRAHEATSCGRYRRNGLRHCGRCVPCLIRRAAFVRWGHPDGTPYIYEALGKRDKSHADYNDVRSAGLALTTVETDGLNSLLGASLASDLIPDKDQYRAVVGRGLKEVRRLLESKGVL